MLGDAGVSTDVLLKVGNAVFGFCDGIVKVWEINAKTSGMVVVFITAAVDAVYVRMGVVDGEKAAFLVNCDWVVAGVVIE